MSIKTFKPTTPSRRHMTVNGFDGINKHTIVALVKEGVDLGKIYGELTERHS